MRSIKTSGGLTRGRYLSDSSLSRWVNSFPLCQPICDSLEQFSFRSTPIGTSEQHVELRDSRRQRDIKDIQCFTAWIRERTPFPNNPSIDKSEQLIFLSSGLVVDDKSTVIVLWM